MRSQSALVSIASRDCLHFVDVESLLPFCPDAGAAAAKGREKAANAAIATPRTITFNGLGVCLAAAAAAATEATMANELDAKIVVLSLLLLLLFVLLLLLLLLLSPWF